jgi:hypothetical protein
VSGPYSADLNRLRQLRDAAISNPLSREARAAYYNYLYDSGDRYGRLGAGVVLNNTFAGAVANGYFVEASRRFYGVEITPEHQQHVELRLIELDFAARELSGGPLPYEILRENHRIAFQEVGSGIRAWTADLPVRIGGERAWDRMLIDSTWESGSVHVGFEVLSRIVLLPLPGWGIVDPQLRAEIANWQQMVGFVGARRILAPGSPPRCFLAGTLIQMADGSEKPIEQVRVGDMVMSFDPKADQGRGALIPNRVTRTFENTTQTVLDLRGLRMTPGHVCLTDHGRFETIAAILARDGALVDRDGTALRARTGAAIGSPEDALVRVTWPDPASGQDRFVTVRAGIQCGLRRLPDGSRVPLTLAWMLARAGITPQPGGTLRKAAGQVTDATDWPEGQTPLDHAEQRNWVVTGPDGLPYTPDWIRDIQHEAEAEMAVGATTRRVTAGASTPRFRPTIVGGTIAGFQPIGATFQRRR